MTRPATAPTRAVRRAALLLVVGACVAATAGCGWFRNSVGGYALQGDQRPLEMPPPLEQGDQVAAADGTQSALRSETGAQRTPSTAAAGSGFNVAAPRDQVFARVGEALAATEGLEIASQAQLLGAYDVSYRGGNFLVRVTEVEAGTYVSAVDPRGLPAQGEGATALMAALEAALGGE